MYIDMLLRDRVTGFNVISIVIKMVECFKKTKLPAVYS